MHAKLFVMSLLLALFLGTHGALGALEIAPAAVSDARSEEHGVLLAATRRGYDPFQRPRYERVHAVQRVHVRVAESYPRRLYISASGVARTGGWSNLRLVQRGGPNRSGIYDFELVGLPPRGFATQAFAPVRATTSMIMPGYFRGIRVLAATNSRSAR